jgi:WD40 repeat protein
LELLCELKLVEDDLGPACVADFSLPSRQLAVGYASGEVVIAHVLPGNLVELKGKDPLFSVSARVKGTHVSPIVCLSINGAMERVAIGDQDGMVSVFNLTSGKTVLHEGLNLTSDVDYEHSVAMPSFLHLTRNHFPQSEEDSPAVLLVGSSDGRLRVHNAVAGSFMSSFKMSNREKITFIRSLTQVGQPIKFGLASSRPASPGPGSLRSPVRPTSSQCFLLVCAGRQVYLFSEKLEVVAIASTDSAIKKAEIISDSSKSDEISYALSCFDENGRLYVFGLMTLELIVNVDLKAPGKVLLANSGLVLKAVPDGRPESAILFSSTSRLFQKERIPESFFPSTSLGLDIPVVTPLTKFVVHGVPKVLKKQKSMFVSLKNVLPLGNKDNLLEVCKFTFVYC